MGTNNNQIKNVNSQDIHKVGYHGDVKIKFIKDNTVKKTIRKQNRGTNLLFNLIAMSIAGYDVRNSIPRYLDVLKTETNQETKSVLSYKPNLTANVPKMVGGMWVVDFTAFVPSSAIKSGEEKFNTLRIYNNATNENSLMAEVTLTSEETIPSDYAIAIDWQMQIGNAQIETESSSQETSSQTEEQS